LAAVVVEGSPVDDRSVKITTDPATENVKIKITDAGGKTVEHEMDQWSWRVRPNKLIILKKNHVKKFSAYLTAISWWCREGRRRGIEKIRKSKKCSTPFTFCMPSILRCNAIIINDNKECINHSTCSLFIKKNSREIHYATRRLDFTGQRINFIFVRFQVKQI
jgi:hypothetical protein